MLLVGDFELSEDNRDDIHELLLNHFNLTPKKYPNGQITVCGFFHSTFSTGIHHICEPNFSHYYPVLYKIPL